MGAIISHNSFDYQQITIVPVIASFNTEGKIKPLYVRIKDKSYKIDSFWVMYTFTNITEFNCKISDGENIYPLKLTYYHAEGVWCMPK